MSVTEWHAEKIRGLVRYERGDSEGLSVRIESKELES